MAGKIRRIAFVSGATSGIGRATALRLARDGVAVGLMGRNRNAAESLGAEIAAAGGTALPLPGDVSIDGEVAAQVAALVQAYGGIDIVVASAGIAMTAPMTEMAEADWRRIIDVNLTGTFLVARHCFPHLIARGGGSFIAVSSDAGTLGSIGYAAYCASKHGVNGFVRALALEYGPRNIRSNAVAPGFVETPMAERLLSGIPPEKRRSYEQAVPLGRFARAEEVADAIAYLASPAASYANGVFYALDGGATSGHFSPAKLFG